MINHYSFSDIHKIAADYDKNLKASDKRFAGRAKIIHEDGSSFCFERAFFMRCEDWVIVFSEHNGHHAFHKDSIAFISHNWARIRKLNVKRSK